MPELLWVLGLLAVVCAAATVELVPWPVLLEGGNTFMLASAAIGVPVELVYYLLLAIALAYAGRRPSGWFWRPFQHHHLLGPRQRWLVLPWFYTGALAFVAIVLGIAVVLLGMLAAVVQSGR
jgi:hypothetical protein